MHEALPRPRFIEVVGSKRRLLTDFQIDDIVIPRGFEWDGASTLGVLIKRWTGHHQTADLVHDFLYSRLNEGRPYGGYRTRYAADRKYLELLKRSGVGFITRRLMYRAVRVFGGKGPLKRLVVRG